MIDIRKEDFFYHPEWIYNRLKVISEYIPDDFWNNKKVLELGSFHSEIGNYFSKLGAKVTCFEGRELNVSQAKSKFPNLDIIQYDIENLVLKENEYDVIINFGLLYHMKNIENLLDQCGKACTYMLLETEVIDSKDKNLNIVDKEGIDQSINNEKIGIRPNEFWIENKLRQYNFHYEKINSKKLNSHNVHHYDWKNKYNNSYSVGKRRFWICEKVK